MGEAAEEFETIIDLVAGERLQALGTELLDSEGTHHASVEHGVLQHQRSDFALRGHVAHEATGKRVSGAGGIVHLLDGQSGRTERMMRAEAEGAFAKE